MVFYPHFNTQKTPGAQKPIRRKSKGSSMCAEKESICPPKKSYLQKNHSVRKKSPSDCPFACQTATSLPAMMSIFTAHTHTSGTFPRLQQLIPPHRAASLPRLPWFSDRTIDFSAFIFLLRAQHASETGYNLNVLPFVRDRQPVTASARYFRHQRQIYPFSLFFLRAKANNLRSLLRLL